LSKKLSRAPIGGAPADGRSRSRFATARTKGTGFAPEKQDIAEAKTVAWCGSKHSHNGCFRDGSHANLT